MIPNGRNFPLCATDEERIIGNKGQTHGARIVTTPEINANKSRRSIVRVYTEESEITSMHLTSYSNYVINGRIMYIREGDLVGNPGLIKELNPVEVRQIIRHATNRYELDGYKELLHYVNSGEYTQCPPFLSAIREQQEEQDRNFEKHLPQQFEEISKTFDSDKERWEQVLRAREDVIKVLRKNNIDPRFVMVVRAKSKFSADEKMNRFALQRDELYDLLGGRIVIASDEPEEKQVEHARNIAKVLKGSEKFSLMYPEVFSRYPLGIPGTTVVHDPYRDTLSGITHSGHRRIRMNVRWHEDANDPVNSNELKNRNILEMQIITQGSFKQLNEEGKILHK